MYFSFNWLCVLFCVNLEHLKLKLKLSSIINNNYIVTFANSLSNSLQKLGLDIYDDDEGNDLISYFLCDDDGKFKLFKYVGKNFTEDFDHDLLQKE
ncbi:hypothetical protein C1645_812953 [Glomus cerebriforme]|uniref:Uncharacterized protein n=1 Tax=Glomus cerebriforme TaxID=658196 RepID=A0A397TJS6_9GLOM|nr:hypothetical protein C1645_812953 [Glomus cerebriforme]